MYQAPVYPIYVQPLIAALHPAPWLPTQIHRQQQALYEQLGKHDQAIQDYFQAVPALQQGDRHDPHTARL